MKQLFTLFGLICLLSMTCQTELLAQPKHSLTYHVLFPNYLTPDNPDREFRDNYSEAVGRGVAISYQRHLGSNYYLGLPLKFMVTPIQRFGTDGLQGRRNSIGNVDLLFSKYFFQPRHALRPYVNLGPSLAYNFTTDKAAANFPVGLGLNLRLVEGVYLDAYSQYRTATNEETGWHHGLGFNFLFGGAPEEPKLPPPPADRDGDGLPDITDKCPDEAGPAATMGCPDSDGDGIANGDDKCPDLAGVAQFMGCPDTDGDGVADPDDACPNQAGPISNKGCPIKDTDGDGLPDSEDKCPNEAGPRSNGGCPLADRDGDGIADADDACPDVKGEARFKGCPDTDGDGVGDNVDKCPKEKGPASNQGCPEIKVEDKAKLEAAIRNVQFNTSSATLTTASLAILDEVASIMNSYPAYSMTISGHTDSQGDDILNKRLSENRAKACYDYLVKKGVAAARMSHAGYGETQPIAENTTAAGRAQNRRVIFNMFVPK